MIKFAKQKIAVTADCKFGLGNRLYTIIGALYIAKKLNLQTIAVNWKPDNECACQFDDLFEPLPDINFNDTIKSDVLNIFINFYFNNTLIKKNQISYLVTDNLIVRIKNIIYKHSSQKHTLNLVYTSTILPQECDIKFINNFFNSLKVKNNISKKVNQFITKKNIGKDIAGLHFRRTDKTKFESNIVSSHYNKALTHIHNNPQKYFFVASDDYCFLKILSIYKNVIHFPTKYYPFYDKITKEIKRDKESVINSLITMIVLSRTTIFNTDIVDHSAFLGCAYYLSFVDTGTLLQ
jgi:hypothetical protein